MNSISPSPWLVTGAAGFLGSHVTERLLDEGIPVVAVDSLAWGPLHHLARLDGRSGFQLVVADIRDAAAMNRIFGQYRPNSVIHLAALHYIPAAEADPPLAIDINVRGTQTVLSAAEAEGAERFWFASTGDVYAPSESPHCEDETPGPFNVYGLSKRLGEQLIELASRRKPRKRFVVGRLFNLYGPRETNPHLLPEVLKQLRDSPGSPLRLGNLWPRRDMLPVEEAARAVIDMTKKAAEGLAVVNVGTGVTHSMDDLIRMLGELAGFRIEIQTDPAKVRPVERPHLQADVSRLRQMLNWTPHADLRKGLASLLAKEPISGP